MTQKTFQKKNVKIQTFVFYCTIALLLGATIPSVSSDTADPWWNTSWTCRKEITIDHTKISSALSHFPLLIRLTDSDLQSQAQPDGDDIVFTDKNGVQLNHEIESYDSSTGALTAWVDIPTLSATVDTTIYLYYNNPSSGSQQAREATWDAHYLAVHHLEENTGTILDSTSNDNDGAPSGSPNQNVVGKIDGADAFDGVNDHFTLPQVYTSETQFTMEAWIYAQSGARYFISQRASSGVFLQINGNFLQYYINGVSDGRTVSLNTWYHIVLSYDGTTASLYVNGAVRNKACTPPTWPAEGLYLGDRSTGGRPFNGMMDEVRFSDTARSNGWILTSYNNQNNPTSFYTLGSEETTPSGESYWHYRKPITIDHAQISATLMNFPLLFTIIDSDLASEAQENGNDIYFTDDGGQRISHEIERFNGANGELTAWINIPSLSSSSDTILYMYYGNPDADSQETIEATWDSNYLAVHHLDESTGTIIDSTVHNNDGIPSGAPNQNVVGKIDGADAFDGVNDHFTLPQVYTSETQFTMEAWIYAQSGARYFISQRASSGVFLQINGNFLQYYINSASDGRTVSLNTWYHIVLSYDGTTATLYTNGATRTRLCTPPTWPAEGLYLGDRSTGGRPFNGMIDEVRFSNTARSLGWILTCYYNQNNPSSFYTLGSEENLQEGHAPIITNEQPPNGAINVPITLSQLSFTLSDTDNDLLNCTITTTPDIIGGTHLENNINSGTTVSIPIITTPLPYGATYSWHITSNDGTSWTNRTFSFTTITNTNTKPTVTNPYPADNAVGIGINPVLAITISDNENDNIAVLFMTNASTGVWHQIGSTQTGSPGRYSQPTTEFNQMNKKYWWSVRATDPLGSGGWTNRTYSFSTSPNTPPVLSNINPSNSQNVPYNPRLSVRVTDNENNPLTVIFKTNASGSWETLGTYYGGNNVYAHNTSNMEIKNKRYYWRISVTDGYFWVNTTYSFIAQAFVLKWTYNGNANTSIGPLAVDVNNDGVDEIFATGVGKAYCVNGKTGALIWQYYNSEIIYHSPFEIGDLNNDGIPEMVISGRETTINQGKTIALHANDGSVYWIINQESGGKYLCIADIDGNHRPYVYICSGDFDHGINGYGRLRKLRGTDGAVLKEVFVWRPCWGGISCADSDNDGKFEIYITERMADYRREGQLCLGMQCYDAETLDLLWYQDGITCSSHTMVLADVNNDGILDALASQQSSNNGGIFTVDGATWDKMPGYWNYRVTGLASHSNFPVYDIDNDGIFEFITGTDGPQRLFKLGVWNTYVDLGNGSEPPKMANVIGDQKLEIISMSRGAKIFNTTGSLIETITNCYGMDTTLVQDVDYDWQNELIVLAGNGALRCYDTSAYASVPRLRTNAQFYSERRASVGVYVPPPGAPQPIIKTMLPANNSQDVLPNPTLRTHIVDFHYDLMNITISTNATGSWVTLATYQNVGNGWFNISTTTMAMKNRTYYWRVTAFDPYADRMTTTKTYQFTTSASPRISDIIATPSVVPPGSPVNISCSVRDGTSVNIVKVNITAPNGQKTNVTASGGTPVWTTLAYDDFESGMGNFTLGGSSSSWYTGDTYSHQGTQAVKIQDYLGLNSSFYLTLPIDVHTPRYTSIKVDFWFKAHNMSNLSNFWVKFYDGQHWRIVDNYIKPGAQGYRPTDKPFENGTFYHAITWINESKYTFPTNMKIRFECDASGSAKCAYIDQVYINATTTQGPNFYSRNTYTQEGQYQYYIWAKDPSGNSVRSGLYTFTVD
jgi:GR25 family glycosyltransferase involved in LPS biosynthesis